MDGNDCCGLSAADSCRCHTDAALIAASVRSFVAGRVRRPEDAEDVAQDALLRLYRGAASLRDEQALQAWMYRIAESAVVDHYRRSGNRPEPVAPEELPAPAEPAEEPRAVAELAACLPPLLARIPDDYRAALELTDLGELTQQQAAEQLGISTSGMKSRVQRGRRMLRTEVGRCCRIELDAGGALADAQLRADAC
jgi:RNA polymerase sigma-70 factor (ECF subfamily)